jgi:hypothetical protein
MPCAKGTEFSIIDTDRPPVTLPYVLAGFHMTITSEDLKTLIEVELATLSDVRVVAHIRAMLVEPHVLLRGWDYGEPGQQYPCWMVLMDDRSGGEIAYCEYGFGPRCPWGLVSSAKEYQSMGMDSGWYTSFLDAFFNSFACVDLPIWRVFKVEPDGTRTAMTDEGPWEPTWSRVNDLRSNEPTNRYECSHSINYGRQHA